MIDAAMLEVVEKFRTQEDEAAVTIVVDDVVAQSVLFAWPQVPREFGIFERPPQWAEDAAFWDAIWKPVFFSMEKVASLAGVPRELTEVIMGRLKGARLIYPDGRISDKAREILIQRAKEPRR